MAVVVPTVTDDEAIYRALRTPLVRYASALVGPDEAADVVATVMSRVLARRRLSELDDPRTYLFRAVGNEARSHRRQRARRPVVRLAAADIPTVPDDSYDAALDLVWDLPVRQRAATYLVYWLRFTPTEAAEAMGCRPATVRRYLHLARAKLMEVFDDHDA